MADVTAQDPKTSSKLSRGFWLRSAGSFLGAGLLAAAVLNMGEGGDAPAIGLLLAGALVVSVLTLPFLYLAIVREMKLPARVAMFAVVYNALLIAVKFILAPRGLYEVNREVELTSLFPLTNISGALATAAAVSLLYLAVYTAIYLVFRRRIRELRARPKRELKRFVRPVLIVGVLLTITGAGLYLLVGALLVAANGAEYLSFVFSSSLSLLVALALAVASGLAIGAFAEVTDRTLALGDAALLASFFWLGLYFIALYHVLWVVYILVITSIWPLRVVVPK